MLILMNLPIADGEDPDSWAEASNSIMMEINSTADRAAAISAGSLLEEALERALKGFLRAENKDVVSNLFRPSGALGAFETKIHLGLVTGLFGPDLHRELSYIKKIRNEFAHVLPCRDFTYERVASWCRELKFPDRYLASTNDGQLPPQAAPNSPILEWPSWIGHHMADQIKSTPRGRYLASVSLCDYALVSQARRRLGPPQV